MNESRPIRILQTVSGWTRGGGVEAYLLQVLRHIDRKRFHMDFLVPTSEPHDYDEEIRALGANIFPCLQARRPSRYRGGLCRTSLKAEYALHFAGFFRWMLREHGPYDIVHAHM